MCKLERGSRLAKRVAVPAGNVYAPMPMLWHRLTGLTAGMVMTTPAG